MPSLASLWERRAPSTSFRRTSRKNDDEFELKNPRWCLTYGLERGKLKKGRTESEHTCREKEYQPVSKCLQWLATQFRPDLSAVVSLIAHGNQSINVDPKALYDAVGFAKEVDFGITFLRTMKPSHGPMPISSRANATRSSSQLGVLIGLVCPEVVKQPCPFSVIDWKSSWNPRVCRSTLTAAATAADKASDTAGHIVQNICLCEFLS